MNPTTTPEYALERAESARNEVDWNDREPIEREGTKKAVRELLATGWFSGGQIGAITGAPTHIVRMLARGTNPSKRGGALSPKSLGDLRRLRQTALGSGARERGRWTEPVVTLAKQIVAQGTSPGTIERFTGIPAKRVEVWVREVTE